VRGLLMFVSMITLLFWSASGITEVFFSPDDRPASRLVQLINEAHTKIYAAIYMITDKNIAEALVRAKKRGVAVQVIVDPSSMEGSYGKGQLLKMGNVDLFVFGKENSRQGSFHQPLMHNKFAVIDNNVWTGSFNWTKSANEKNQENVILTDDVRVKDRFEHHFELLKQRCRHYACKQQPVVEQLQRRTESNSWWQEMLSRTSQAVSNFFVFIQNDIRKTMAQNS
jgi:phosphatidylserine/phosphatidylglycerophosphate/cardiolipin synthase-like enzyme